MLIFQELEVSVGVTISRLWSNWNVQSVVLKISELFLISIRKMIFGNGSTVAIIVIGKNVMKKKKNCILNITPE